MLALEVGNMEHKLFLYADDILAEVTNPLTLLPHLMDTVQSHLKLSGYRSNSMKTLRKTKHQIISPVIQINRPFSIQQEE